MNREISQVAEGARKSKLAPDSLIELYERLSLIVYDNQEKYNYECSGSGIGQGAIDFTIVFKKGQQMPKYLNDLFFNNIDHQFKVECKKVADGIYKENEDAYNFEIKLYQK